MDRIGFSEEYTGLLAKSTTQETTPENIITTQEKILALIKFKPTITRVEMAKVVGISSNGIRYHLDKLKEAGKIKHVGPTKAGHWEIINE